MGIFTKDIKSMEDLLLHGLQDIYYAEQQILKALPKMIEKATNHDLVTGLKSHLEETNKQIERLQKVFEKLGKQLSGTQCPRSTASSRKRTRPLANRGQGGFGRGNCRERAGRRALRNVPLRDADRVGRTTRSRRDRCAS